jgi:hypothetical protein
MAENKENANKKMSKEDRIAARQQKVNMIFIFSFK